MEGYEGTTRNGIDLPNTTKHSDERCIHPRSLQLMQGIGKRSGIMHPEPNISAEFGKSLRELGCSTRRCFGRTHVRVVIGRNFGGITAWSISTRIFRTNALRPTRHRYDQRHLVRAAMNSAVAILMYDQR
jgi:hypothetical protein